MLSTHNMLSPASGEPLVAPTLDMVLGCYYLTEIEPGARGEGSKFYNFDEARIAYETQVPDGNGRLERLLDLRARISVRDIPGVGNGEGWVETTLGRLIFNENLPEVVEFPEPRL